MEKKQLQIAERELSQIRNALDKSAIVAITDNKGTIIHINDKFCEISKYSREELLGQNHRLINSGYHNADFFKNMWSTIAKGQIWEGEIRNRAKDGSIYWVNTTIVPFADDNGKPYQFVSIRYEITQRKQAEEQLRIYAERLENSVKEISNRETQILVQDRLASVGLLASSLAHEIGTPLGVIRGRAEYLELQLRDNANVKKSVDIIISQIDRVSKLIRSLLNLARGSERKFMVEPVELAVVTEEVTDLMAHEFRKSEIEIINNTQGFKVKAESGPLHQVLLNLFVNAVHAIESVKKERPSGHFIRMSVLDQGEYWAICVEDTGCGISAENLKNLFKPFFTTKDIGMGTGLGLATSYRIVESWGGRIEVKSALGIGSEFQIILPK